MRHIGWYSHFRWSKSKFQSRLNWKCYSLYMFVVLHLTFLHRITFEHGAELGDERHAARAEVLADGHLLEEDGDAAEGHRREVDDQEGAWWG